MADKRTNEQVDKINEMRKQIGEELLPYETEDGGSGGGESEEEKQKAIEAKKIADQKIIDDAAAETERLRLEEEKKKTAQPVAIDDAAVLAYLKSKGKEVSSLDEILNPKVEATKEDKEKEAQQRENNKIAYALQNNKFSDKELKAFITDSKNPHELVKAQYIKEQMALDTELTAEEAEDEYKEKYGLNEKEDSRKYKRGQNELNLLADTILRKEHAKVINFDNEYTGIETEQLTQKQIQQKILSQAPVYKKEVEEVYNELKKVTVSFGGSNYEIEVPQEILDAQKSAELEDAYAASEIKNGWTKEKKKDTAKTALIIANLPLFMQSAAEQYAKTKAAGTHGIPPIGEKEKLEEQKTARQENLKKFHGDFIAETATN